MCTLRKEREEVRRKKDRHRCCVQAIFLGKEKKLLIPCYGIFSVKNVFEALNLVLNKYVAKIQLPGNEIFRLPFLPQSSGTACIGDFHHTRFMQNANAAAILYSSFQLQLTVPCR
jgi:hypothetical protein